MSEKVLDFVKVVGAPWTVALVLVYLMLKLADAQATDRHDYALLLMQEINDLQAQVEKVCK